METINCTKCGENVETIRRSVATKQKIIKQACDCTEASHDAMAYEVEGWDWISYDG